MRPHERERSLRAPDFGLDHISGAHPVYRHAAAGQRLVVRLYPAYALKPLEVRRVRQTRLKLSAGDHVARTY
ncbi:MAG: hypothetical protein ACXWQR_10435 [Ktedonobacterales bacterium]